MKRIRYLIVVWALFAFSVLNVYAFAEDYSSYIRAAEAYCVEEDYDSAISFYEMAKAEFPDAVEAYIGEARAFALMQKYDEAFIALGDALEFEPADEEALILKDQLENLIEGSTIRASSSFYSSNNSLPRGENAVDSEKPYIDLASIEVDNGRVTIGESVCISVSISDNVGVKRANISLRNKQSNKLLSYKALEYNPDTDKWEYLFVVDENTPSGIWDITEMQAYDDIGNVVVVSPFKDAFEVYGGADSEKPYIDLASIEVDNGRVTIGESVCISVSISDNVGVKRANISLRNKQSNKLLSYKALEYNPDTDKWEYLFVVDENTPSGIWDITEMQAYDDIGNVVVVSPFKDAFEVYFYYDFSTVPCIMIPEDVKVIEYESFAGCGFSNVVIPTSCIEIQERAFADTNSVLRIFIPSSVTSIAKNAFENCHSVIIYSDENCYAQQYATENQLHFVLNN